MSYEKIEGYYIDENLRLAKKLPGYKFQIETPCVVENYLRRFPEREEELRDLYRRGVLKTTNTGYTILDSNMISPEAIVRNYLLADAFLHGSSVLHRGSPIVAMPLATVRKCRRS